MKEKGLVSILVKKEEPDSEPHVYCNLLLLTIIRY